jgi:urate oxidase
VNDRIFSTSVDLSYTFAPISISPPGDQDKLEFAIPIADSGVEGSVWDTKIPASARKVTLDVFALDDSASVQASTQRFEPGLPSRAFVLRIP